jgi:NitT/TauT family transport system substrate-binding protein
LIPSEGAGYLPQPRAAIERALTHYEPTEPGQVGAIHHPGWGGSRSDFQPFPYPSYTEALVGMLKDTLVEGDTAFLRALDAKRVHAELVDDRFARKAIAAAGGAGRFGLDAGWQRRENIEL